MTRRALLAAATLTAMGGMVVGAFSLETEDFMWPLSWLAWAPMGLLILIRRPGNKLGSALMFIGLSWGVSFAFLAVATSSAPLGVRMWGETVNIVFGVLPWLGIIWLLLVFPHGTYPGRWEKRVGRMIIGFAVLAGGAFAVASEPMMETGVPSPLSIPLLAPVARAVTSNQGFLIVVALLLAAVILLAQRWRRSGGVERAQYRWLLYGVVLFFLVLVAGQFLPQDNFGSFLMLPAGFAIPVTMGVAITRYRLFDIDRVISRTLSYVVILGLLGAVYFGMIAVGTTLLPSDNPVAVAGATLAVAALFNPLRRRLQRLMDRRFNRSRYDAERVFADFVRTLNDRIEPGQVIAGWVGVVSETMQPGSIGWWVRR